MQWYRVPAYVLARSSPSSNAAPTCRVHRVSTAKRRENVTYTCSKQQQHYVISTLTQPGWLPLPLCLICRSSSLGFIRHFLPLLDLFQDTACKEASFRRQREHPRTEPGPVRPASQISRATKKRQAKWCEQAVYSTPNSPLLTMSFGADGCHCPAERILFWSAEFSPDEHSNGTARAETCCPSRK